MDQEPAQRYRNFALKKKEQTENKIKKTARYRALLLAMLQGHFDDIIFLEKSLRFHVDQFCFLTVPYVRTLEQSRSN